MGPGTALELWSKLKDGKENQLILPCVKLVDTIHKLLLSHVNMVLECSRVTKIPLDMQTVRLKLAPSCSRNKIKAVGFCCLLRLGDGYQQHRGMLPRRAMNCWYSTF